MSINSNIILIGFMGSGKSTIGRLLAEELALSFYETDRILLENSGFDSIPAIFEQKGEQFFRDLETQTCKDLAIYLNQQGLGVISTGGGLSLRKENLFFFKNTSNAYQSMVIFLDTKFKTIKERIAGLNDRPLFKNPEQAEIIFNARESIYRSQADLIIQTDIQSPNEIVQEIIQRLSEI